MDERDWRILGSETYSVYYRVSHDKGGGESDPLWKISITDAFVFPEAFPKSQALYKRCGRGQEGTRANQNFTYLSNHIQNHA